MNQIKSYYEKYLDTSGTKSERKKLPRALRHFVLAFAMKASILCKKSMLCEFSLFADRVVSDSDIKLLLLTDKQSYIGALLDKKTEPAKL